MDTDMEFDTAKREAHARAMLQKMTAHEKQRLWRWALRGIVVDASACKGHNAIVKTT